MKECMQIVYHPETKIRLRAVRFASTPLFAILTYLAQSYKRRILNAKCPNAY